MLAKAVLDLKRTRRPDFPVRCEVIAAIAAKPGETCSANDLIAGLSEDWFAQIMSGSDGPDCKGAPFRDVLLFQDPKSRRLHQYPITEFDVAVCSVPSRSAPSGLRILSVTVSRDDIA